VYLTKIKNAFLLLNPSKFAYFALPIFSIIKLKANISKSKTTGNF